MVMFSMNRSYLRLFLVVAAAYSIACFSYCGRPVRSRSKNNQRVIFEKKIPKEISPSRLNMGNWWEDDLPNILGINPIEAAIIVGLLYYIYGPVVLYDYAREAGKAVSTFVPIIRDVTTDIFNEFRENMEENKEIEMLRKQGLDMSNYQKRTTNIFERFQTEYEVSPNLSLI